MNTSAIGISMEEETYVSHVDPNREPIAYTENNEHRAETFVLADAFSDFISSSSRLESSYRELQEEVNGLGVELAVRNAALTNSRAENDRMRLALQQIVDSMPCGVLVVDRDGKVSMLNPESVRILGLACAPLSDRIPTTLREISARSGINLDLFCGSSPEHDNAQKLRTRRCSAEKQWLEIRSRRLHQQSGVAGKPDQTILILQDITAQKRAEEGRDAGRKAMALAEITTMLAHEIRNPLASLELFAEMIEKDSERTSEWVSNLHAGIRSLSATVNNVLSFHESGSLSLIPICLDSVVTNAIRFAQPLADQADVLLRGSESRDSLKIMGNESALQQVILNLITNALRHTPAKGTVTFALETKTLTVAEREPASSSKLVILQVSDTGRGIPEDVIDQIFTPGFSGSNDRTGLGLAVCKQIMKQHDGKISASNILQSGARFTLEFPIFQAEQA
jgi:two-component system sensor histidine kinase FlrB